MGLALTAFAFVPAMAQDSTMNGYVTAAAAFTSGDSAKIQGSVSAKAAFTSGANSVIGGNVYVNGSVTLGAVD